MGQLWAGSRLALGTLTVVPSGDVGDITPRVARSAMLLAPVAAIPVAVAVAVWVGAAAFLHAPPLLTAAGVGVAIALMTRAMHLDGLADTIDGFGAGWSRERALDVMKTGDVGPMGVAALMGTALLQVGALSSMLATPYPWLVVGVIVATSRSGCTFASIRGLRSARPAGLGVVMAESVPRVGALGAAFTTAATLTAVSFLVFSSPVPGLIAWACGIIASAVVLWRAVVVFGGVTGDVMGASIELQYTAMLIGWSLSGGNI